MFELFYCQTAFLVSLSEVWFLSLVIFTSLCLVVSEQQWRDFHRVYIINEKSRKTMNVITIFYQLRRKPQRERVLDKKLRSRKKKTKSDDKRRTAGRVKKEWSALSSTPSPPPLTSHLSYILYLPFVFFMSFTGLIQCCVQCFSEQIPLLWCTDYRVVFNNSLKRQRAVILQLLKDVVCDPVVQ